MTDPAAVERHLLRDFVEQFPEEVARELAGATADDVVDVLGELDPALRAGLVQRLPPDAGGRAIERLPAEAAAEITSKLEPTQAARLCARLGRDARDAVLARMPPHVAREIAELSAYPPGTAGALMDPQVLALHPGSTVAEALVRLRDLVHKSIYRVYVVDGTERLLGSVRVRELAVADPEGTLGEVLHPGPAAVPVTATREDVSEILDRERVASLPVVDIHGRLVGVLRYDALLDATRDDAAGDILSMVGAGKEERALSPVTYAVRKRLPWLQINLLTAFLAASVVGLFESTIARFTALAVLLPVVAGQSGNTGAQALAVTMRGLALREVRVRQWARVCWKEANVGLINGVAVALTTSLAVLVWSRSTGLAMVIGVSMVLSMVAAGLAGAATPMVLTALRQDPAQSSSIILTTVTDVFGFFSFLGIATLLSAML